MDNLPRFAVRGLRLVLGTLLCAGILASPLVSQTNMNGVFDATNGSVIVPHAAALTFSGRMTLEAWIKPSRPSHAFAAIIDKDYEASFGFGLQTNGPDSANPVLKLGPMQFVAPKISTSAAAWIHVAVTVDTVAKSMIMYVNGTQKAATSGGHYPLIDNTVALRLGASTYGDPYNGLLDEVRIWNVIRTPGQIESMKNREARGNEPGLVALYQFDDIRDTVAFNRAAGGGLKGSFSKAPAIVAEPWDFAFNSEYEENGRFFLATPLPYGRFLSSASIAVGDTDVYKFFARAGDTFTLAGTPSSPSNGIVHVGVYGPDTTTLVASQDATYPSISVGVSTQGYHYITMVLASGTGGSYTLQSTLAGIVGIDAREPNDSPAKATHLALGDTVHASLYPGVDAAQVPDTDYYQLNANAGDLLLVWCLPEDLWGGTINPELCDATGTPLVYRDYYPLTYPIAASGSYYLRVSPLSGSTPYVCGVYKGLVDVHGFLYDPGMYSYSTYLQNGTFDAYDAGYQLLVNGTTYGGLPDYTKVEADGRQLVFKPQSMQGLEVARKFFVPSAAQGDTLGYMRVEEILTNKGATPVTVTIGVYADLGSDSETRVLATSSGDTLATQNDSWLITDDRLSVGGGITNDPTLTHIIDGWNAPDRIDTLICKYGAGTLRWEWRSVTVAPGETKIYMYFVAQDSDAVTAALRPQAFATGARWMPAMLGLGADALYVRNWDFGGDAVNEPPAIMPGTYVLEQNFPNPFNPTTGVRFQVPALSGVEGSGDSKVKLVVYDVLGREVAVLVHERKTPGTYTVKFDGSGLSSGMYIYRLTAGSFVQSRKMILLR